MDSSDNDDHQQLLRNNGNNNGSTAAGTEEANDNPTSSSSSSQQKDCSSSSSAMYGGGAGAGGVGGGVTTNGATTAADTTAERRTAKISSSFGDYKNIRATAGGGESSPIVDPPFRREENPFSFKHFLSRDTAISSPSSSIVTNLNLNNQPTSSSSSSKTAACTSSTSLNNDLIDSHIHSQQHVHSSSINNNCTSSSSDRSPAAAAAATTTASTSSLSSVSSYQTSTGARPKVPQSSSVSTTSMSSLAGGGDATPAASSTSSASTRMKRSPRFSSFDSQASLAEYTRNIAQNAPHGSDGGVGGGVGSAGEADPSSWIGLAEDLDLHMVTSTERQDRFGHNNRYENNGSVHRSFSNYDMGLPGPSSCGGRTSPRRKISPARPNLLGGIFPQGSNSNNPSSSGRPSNPEFAAGALPDFVQDHWMDPFYSSRPNTPVSPGNLDRPDLPVGMVNPEMCQTLPDFLSDGPIIHSSGRLADVASGLPDMDSPEDDSPTVQMSRLRLENDRLRRELDETRLSLADQTRRAGELERVLEQTRSSESAYNRTLAQNIGLVEENLDQSKKRTAAAQNQVSKLKQQVKQLTAEVETLRRENESLREEGAVGGREREPRRPSRTQQLSRDLMHAASTAEINLRQLLHGVENLRLMATAIETMDPSGIESPTNPDPHHISDDFLSDCDDYDEYTGGPAL